MDALELLTVMCAVLALAVAGALAVLCARALRAARALEQAVADFDDAVSPAVAELRSAARRASGEVERLDDLLDVATAVGDRLDTATEATYRALTSPVIKGVAFASGTRRAARRLTGRATLPNHDGGPNHDSAPNHDSSPSHDSRQNGVRQR